MGEIIFVVLIVAGFAGLIVWALRYSNWPADNKDEGEDEPDAGMGIPHIPGPQPVAGWEWQGLQARDALSLIAPDADHTYSVRINDDSSFSVRMDP